MKVIYGQDPKHVIHYPGDNDGLSINLRTTLCGLPQLGKYITESGRFETTCPACKIAAVKERILK